MPDAEIINDDTRFAQLSDPWRDLLADSDTNHPFLTWEWAHAWWGSLRADRQLHIVAVREGDRLIALAPLALRPARLLRLQPYRLLEFLGCGQVGADYQDFIVRRGASARALPVLADALASSGRVLELSRVTPESSVASLLAGRLDGRGWETITESTDVCPFIDLAGHDWTSYQRSLGSAHRSNVKRRLRKLEEAFDVRFELADATNLDGSFDELVRLHLMRREELGGSDALHAGELVDFHRDFTARALANGWLRLFLLRLDGVAAAAVYGLRYNDTFYYYQAGFDPRFRDYSVGLAALALAVRSAFEEGARECDLLHGNERYKYLWASGQRELVRLTLYPAGARVVRTLATFKSRLKNLRGHAALVGES